ncbi:acyl carrier protein [Streptomyces sp. LN245]|uniref:acyl carrier protein n=1 Tax=Streptomyces sp. LN245 TaxID=3112975 RepID=UPI003718383B
MSNAIDSRISDVLRSVAERPDTFEISGEQRLNADLGIDSLKFIDVIVHVEAAFDIELGDDFSRDLVTVADLDTYIAGIAAK